MKNFSNGKESSVNDNNPKLWSEESVFCFTADVDWASEEVLEICHRFFSDHGVKVTYFMTHPSPYLRGLLDGNKIEAGLHPNFLPDSSQGGSIPEVLEYCMKLIPEPRCFRSHRYFDVTDITHGFFSRGLRYDGNICTFLTQGIVPFEHESGLIRFPTFFEDGTYLKRGPGLDFTAVKDSLFNRPGLKIVSVHPMHIVMNSPDLGYSRKIKDSVSREEWNRLGGPGLLKLQYTRRGIRDFIGELIEDVTAQKRQIETMDGLFRRWSSN